MSGFYGWCAGNPAAPGLSRLRAETPPAPDGTAVERLERGPCGLVLAPGVAPGSLAEAGPLIGAIEGEPRWAAPRLAELAAASGQARALLEAYRESGADLLDGLTGSFSLAVLDSARGEALLAIDRSGIGTLCHGRSAEGHLAFATTADPLRLKLPEAAGLSAQAIFDFFFLVDRVPAPTTIYQGIRKLPPATRLLWQAGDETARPYWRMPYAAHAAQSDAELAEALATRLRAAVAACLEGKAPERLGCFLSGGLDSSTVLGLMSEPIGRGAQAFTIGFKPEGFDESAYAALAAEHFGARHDSYYLEPADVLDGLPKLAAAYDEPFANSSALPAYYCALRAKQAGVAVMLAGDGGDELFAGNARYLSDRVFDPYRRIPGALRRALLEPLLDALPEGLALPLLRKARNYSRAGRLSVPARMHAHNLYRDIAAERVFTPAFLEAVDQAAPLALLESIYEDAAPADKVQKMMHLDLRITLADSDLRKVRRTCELAGLQVRFPFLDDDLIAFSAGIPPARLLAGGRLRGFYKQAMSGLLPRPILDKPKQGFGLPYIHLLGSHAPLKDLVCDSLQSLGARGYFAASFIESMLDSARADDPARVSGYIWDLMMLELWLRSRGIGEAAMPSAAARAAT